MSNIELPQKGFNTSYARIIARNNNILISSLTIKLWRIFQSAKRDIQQEEVNVALKKITRDNGIGKLRENGSLKEALSSRLKVKKILDEDDVLSVSFDEAYKAAMDSSFEELIFSFAKSLRKILANNNVKIHVDDLSDIIREIIEKDSWSIIENAEKFRIEISRRLKPEEQMEEVEDEEVKEEAETETEDETEDGITLDNDTLTLEKDDLAENKETIGNLDEESEDKSLSKAVNLSYKKHVFNKAHARASGKNLQEFIISLATHLTDALIELGAPVGTSELIRELRRVADIYGHDFVRNRDYCRKIFFVKFDIYSK